MQDVEMTLEPTEMIRLCVWQSVGAKTEGDLKQELCILVRCKNEDELSVSFQITDEPKDDLIVQISNGHPSITINSAFSTPITYL